MTTHLGSYNTSSTRTHVRFQFSTNAAAGGNVAPLSAFEAADIRIYKATDGAGFSATQRSSSSGITMTSPFDSLTGYHDVDIDLTDNTDAGFYAAGSFYSVVLSPDTETIDGQTITGIPLAYFEIGPPPVNMTQVNSVAYGSSTLNTLASHDPGATIGTSTLTQTQVTGGAYALNSSSFAFNSGLDFTTTQKAATLARVALVDTATLVVNVSGNVSGKVLGSGVSSIVGVGARVVDSGGNDVASAFTALDAATTNTTLAAIQAQTDKIPASPASTTNITAASGVALSSSGLNLVLVDGKTLPAALQIIAAGVIGKVSGAGTGTESFLGLDGTSTRCVVTVDSSGNRTTVVYS